MAAAQGEVEGERAGWLAGWASVRVGPLGCSGWREGEAGRVEVTGRGPAGRASACERTGLRNGGWAGWAVRVEGKGPAGPVQVGLG